MTDLTNKVNGIEVDKMNELYVRYSSLLETIDKKHLAPYIIYTTDIVIKYIKENHKDLGADLSSWTVVAIKRLFEKGILKDEEDITKEVDGFINHYRNNYQSFLDDISICTNDYDKECGFINEYVHKRKGADKLPLSLL